MKHTSVKSSVIKSVGYDPSEKKMEVMFKNGEVYTYHDVLPHVHAVFINSKSLGSHLVNHIARNHEYTKKPRS